ncbi:TetR/AcrR family transcriptional regulator [Blastococcus xanthinilyticus]|uniref:TetR family transcriptional regulator n=1 Tax=Blastococcus xanthinilyticus TaxID=1564164 RepID=A0A5S5D2B8_9ACTN|nr:TetR/AcrR family transcriptional regulator [Blastococcus xanthinilyticus]TYP88952.1 TetR family transcriptional regulator [Blastococcus xanthinilyticus]
MARRQARFTPQDLEGDPRLQDGSPDLWGDELGEVPRGLLTSAVRCFASNGYHATTTRDITQGVGLSAAALYVHFPSKELVLFEIVRASHEDALAYVRDPRIDQAGDASERLRAIVSRYTAWHARHHVAARVAQYELSGLSAEHYAEILELRHATNDIFRDAVARGVEEGVFASVDVNRVVRAMLSMSIDLIRWYRLDGSDSPEQLGDFYAGLALRMLSAG